jgi:hypothetical protein
METPTRSERAFRALVTPPLWVMARVIDCVDWMVWQLDQVVAKVSR